MGRNNNQYRASKDGLQESTLGSEGEEWAIDVEYVGGRQEVVEDEGREAEVEATEEVEEDEEGPEPNW